MTSDKIRHCLDTGCTKCEHCEVGPTGSKFNPGCYFYGTVGDKTEIALTKFTSWCDDNIIDVVGHEMMCIKSFDGLVRKANIELRKLTNDESDYTSFVCGIVGGMKMMTLNTNEE